MWQDNRITAAALVGLAIGVLLIPIVAQKTSQSVNPNTVTYCYAR